jgi:excisionase family DNA binding protein
MYAMTKQPNAKDWYTVSEAAQSLGITPGRMRQLVASGRVSVWRVNDRLNLISAETLTQFRSQPRLSGAAGHQKNNR